MTELPLVPCRWRTGPSGPGRHGCRSPKLVVGRDGVADDLCPVCYCRDHEPPPDQPKIEWVSTSRLAADSVVLAGKLPPNVSGIIGIPRSGMIPASIIATHLQLPLWELPPIGQLRHLGSGGRGYMGWAGDAAGPMVVVDDTVYGGGSMSHARDQLRGRRVLFTCVYPTQRSSSWVDYYGRVLSDLQILEWNTFNNGPWAGFSAHPEVFQSGIACDFDGILCEEPQVPDADDGPGLEQYQQWLINARPKWLPRRLPTRLIVTGRLETFRKETEDWLHKWGVRWDRLVMHPARTASERFRKNDVAQIKAIEYGKSSCGLFMESDPGQAETIFNITHRPVICPIVNRVWQ